MKNRKNCLALGLLLGLIVPGVQPARAMDVVLLQNTIVDNNALNFASANPPTTFNRNINGRTYQRFPMATFKGYQYATYYDTNRNVCVGRRKLPDGAWQVIRHTDYAIASSDSHNVVAIGICAKDGTIHLAFDHHAHPLNYRVSAQGAASNPEAVVWNTNLFGPVTDQLGAVGTISSVTYPSFFNAPNGNLMLYYRNGGSGSGDGMIQEYNGTTHNWTTGLGKFIARTGTYNGAVSTNSTSRNPYINGISYGGTRLHASWGWRESAATSASNHDLNYAYSDDDGRTWRNSAGTLIGTTGSSFITVDSPGLIVAGIPQDEGLSNQYTHYAYPDGSCHVIVVHNGSYQHYWRNAAGVWSQGTLGFSGSRPKLTGDDDGNLFLVYVSGSRPRIAKGVPNAGQTAWSWSLVHTQSDTTEAGEGQLDYSRWETDRVLSFYGQETPPSSDEGPSPLHVLDYQVSGRAILPQPLDGATEIAFTTNLQWTAGLNATAHRIYWGTNLAAVSVATTNSPEYQGQQTTNSFQLPLLAVGSTYYWRIDEVQSGGTVSPGGVWKFTTTSTHLPPTLSAIADRTILANTNTGPLAFTVGDDATPPGSITLTPGSSNTNLVPLANIVFGGSGSNRTVTVTPALNQGGSALISIIANDGGLSATNSFTLTVWPPGTVIATVTNNTPGTVPWLCPSGVTNIQVECWGGGGAGGGAKRTTTSGGAGGGGAAAGAYARRMNVPVTPGSNYSLTIPAAATCAGGFSDGQRFDGSAVTFIGDGGVTVTAAGGQGGASHIGNANAPAGVGSTNGCVGEQFYRGGSGGNNGSNNGGNGGGGPSDLADGGDGSTTSNSGGGIGATGSDAAHNGGNGGDGRGAGNNGQPGFTPGGGGGGAKSQTQDLEYIGGTGGLGQIILTYVQLPAVEPPTLGYNLSGGGLEFSWSGSGFKLQSRTNLTSGTWLDVSGGTNSPVNVTPALPAEFFRLIQQ